MNTNPTLEALGFQHSLKYGPRSNLRKACMKFLRFSYLLDFLALEALTNIYLYSVEETILKLEQLSNIPISNEFKSTKSIFDAPQLKTSSDQIKIIDDKSKINKGAATSRIIANEYPFFEVLGVFQERPIPESNKVVEYVERYEPPPLGSSSRDDFNPLVHLELEDPDDYPEPEELNYGMMREEDQHNDSNILKHKSITVVGLA